MTMKCIITCMYNMNYFIMNEREREKRGGEREERENTCKR